MSLMASPKDFELKLQIPTETKHTVDGQLLYSYEPEQFRLTTKIFNNYLGLAEAYPLLLEDIDELETENGLFIETLSKCETTLEIVEEDRQFIYRLRESDLKQAAERERVQRIKTILFTGGGVLTGIGIGVLIGLFAI